MELLRFEGVGKRFGGNYYVKRTEHRLSPKNGYTTRFELQRSAG